MIGLLECIYSVYLNYDAYPDSDLDDCQRTPFRARSCKLLLRYMLSNLSYIYTFVARTDFCCHIYCLCTLIKPKSNGVQ